MLLTPRLASLADRFAEIPELEETVRDATWLIEGWVVEQYLIWGREPLAETDDLYPRLVSVIQTSDSQVSVEQATDVSCPEGLVALGYTWWDVALKPGVDLPILAGPSKSVAGILSVMENEAFEVREDGLLRRVTYGDDSWGPLTRDDVRRMFDQPHNY